MAFLPMIGFVVILYFLLIRPQQKRQKQHQQLIASIKKGDKVVTNSGIIATVTKVVSEHEVVLEIATGVHCKFVRSAISSIMSDAAKLIVNSEEKKASPVIEEAKDVATPVQGSPKPDKKAPIKKVVSKRATPKK